MKPFRSSPLHRCIADAKAIFAAAVRAVQADELLAKSDWKRAGDRHVSTFERIHVAGMGKASLAMASVLEARVGSRIAEGCVVVPPAYAASLPARFTAPYVVEILEGGHPIPDAASLRAAERILDLARRSGEGDLLLVLISGGGSALCMGAPEGISLNDLRETNRLLLMSGADIHAVNAVRKHLGRVGGGRLAAAAYPADVLALIVSDVPGDDLSVIASGPTSADPTSFADAQHVLEELGIWRDVPESARRLIEKGMANPALETPKPGDRVLERVTNCLLGTNAVARRAAAAEAERRGYATILMESDQTGEARELGRRLVDEAIKTDREEPYCLIAGGETTVNVRGSGRGGRNQEIALSAALAMQDSHHAMVLLSAGTDGIDGPTDAAGAWATSMTVASAKEQGLDARAYLENNDAYSFFRDTGGHLKTGPTHTNVMDVHIVLK